MTLEVTQEDFDAAQLWWNNSDALRRAEFPDMAQAFAAHRQATERKVVEWLRSHECVLFVPEGMQEPFDEAADAIERGEHRK